MPSYTNKAINTNEMQKWRNAINPDSVSQITNLVNQKANQSDLNTTNDNVNGLTSQLADIATNVKVNFGAKGDGITDDTQAIQNAINSLTNGGVVFFPSGTYLISGTLTISNSNITLMGAFNNSVTIKCSNNTIVSVGQSLDNVNFYHLYFLGGATSTTQYDGIALGDNTSHCTIKFCTFDGFNTGIVALYANEYTVIKHSRFKNMTSVPNGSSVTMGYGILLQASHYTTVERCVFESTVYRHGIYVGRYPSTGTQTQTDEPGYGHKIINNYFFGDKSGTTHLTGYEYRLKIMGNQDVIINGNSFDGGNGGLWLTTDGTANQDCKDIRIFDNEFKNIKGEQIQSGAIVVAGGSMLYDSIIHDNEIHDCNSHGIGLGSSQNIKVHSNVIENLTNWTVSGSTIYPYGVYVYDYITDSEIFGNKITSVSRGIYFQYGGTGSTNSTEVRVYNNEIENVIFGIFSNNLTNGEIFNNKFKSTTDKAILFYAKDFTGSIRHNRFDNVKYILGLNTANVSDFWCYENEVVSVTSQVYDLSTSTSRLMLPARQLGSINANRAFIGTTFPTSGTYFQGDIIYNSNPIASGNIGWVCTLGSTTGGTWKTFGTIGA